MKHIIYPILALILILGLTSNLNASKNINVNSIKITQIVNGFYDWYLSSIKAKNNYGFQPRFIESKNGMTTLDYSLYIENLKIHGFSKDIIYGFR
ncbi:hypothetical protein HNQ88_004168 [Aureibacter tunicatorum]|uniref:Uncharacterized protein n=1 Tax=Aureibacter tunicatorum TaxID=866807 RepID=A0AAE4BUR9_9BACT|nr:hypothetical protein [Aureibacter tunicatorum]BDD03870.1 hypothetical protein AUTU_13530 [Aureibacter tunicatorum]